MEKLEKNVNQNLEKALLLNPEQTKAFRSRNFVATGFYGVGKTVVLEVAIDKIVQNHDQLQKVQIVFVSWDESQELAQKFRKKFDAIRNRKYPHLEKHDSLLVFASWRYVCIKYQVDILQFVNKVDFINCLCRRLQGK